MIDELKSVSSVRLIWREFETKWIYRRTLYWHVANSKFWQGLASRFPWEYIGFRDINLSGDKILFQPIPYYYFSPLENQFFEKGFPLPQQPERGEIFMDDLLLCPECGLFRFSLNPNYKSVDLLVHDDEEARLALIESRWNKKEFEFRKCEDRRECAWYVKAVAESLQKKWSRQGKEAAHIAYFEKKASLRASLKPNIYLIGNAGHVKIGIAIDVRKRLSGLQTSSPVKLNLLKSWQCINASKNEKKLHRKFAKFRANGEWFQLPDDVLQTLIAVDDIDLFLNSQKEEI